MLTKLLGNDLDLSEVIALSSSGVSEMREGKDQNVYMDMLFRGGGEVRLWGTSEEIAAARSHIIDNVNKIYAKRPIA